MRVGQTIQNIHTQAIYTIIEVESVDMGDSLKAVYTISNEAFEVIRFNADYLSNWAVINEEE
jgi:hypothetical protein|tara:strand:- start:496 stop:681 length:186 start_codon:yes stop_codon:yes gene_type:complete